LSQAASTIPLRDIELFCVCAEAGSFTRAAAAVGISPPAMSKAIARLEKRLGVTLFSRNTRRVRLTAAGEQLFERCRPALMQIEDAEREVSGGQVLPSGRVRISLPTPLGHAVLLPLLAEFHERYPDVLVDAHLSNRNVDLIAEGFDLAIRGRTPPPSGLIARRLLDAALVVVAAPGYLNRHGVPTQLDDLQRHECIQFRLPRTGQAVPWELTVDGQPIDIETAGGFHIEEDLLGCVTVCRQSGGLLQTYRFIVDEMVESGELVEVLQDHGGRSRPFSLLYAKDAHMPSRVRVLIDFLIERVSAIRNQRSW
jgi:DNA-binding transcriptional LysR family regulator